MDLASGAVAASSLTSCTSLYCSMFISLLCNPLLWFLQLQSSLTLLGLAIAWLWASQCRVRESNRIRAAQAAGDPLPYADAELCRPPSSLQTQQLDEEGGLLVNLQDDRRQLPMVTVILAVKGFVGEVGMNNWRSQLVTLYGGELEYIFSVESESDPAYFAVQRLQKEMKGRVNIRLVVAGLATSCSQQIHNQMAGAKAASPASSYILFLDDDIQCHPGTIGTLVKAMETRPDAFCVTGYSFDIPSSPSVAAYAAMAYRLPLLVGMSSGGPTGFVWGGCIFLRAADVRADKHGMVTKLKSNGYSNDLILSAVATSNNLTVWCPAAAIFPGRMSGTWAFQRYWNYVRRQQYALFTYSSAHGLLRNLFSCFIYSYLAAAVVVPLIPSLLQLCFFAVSYLRSYFVSFPAIVAEVAATSPFAGSGGAAAAAAGVHAAAGEGTAMGWLSSVAAAHSLCPLGLLMSAFNLSAVVVCCLACIRLFHAVITLCNLLSPEKRPFSVSSLSLPYAVAGMVMNLTLLPVIAIITAAQPAISWAGITYVRRNGLVASVRHPAPLSPKKTGVVGGGRGGAEMDEEGLGGWEEGGKEGSNYNSNGVGGEVALIEAVAVQMDDFEGPHANGVSGNEHAPLLQDEERERERAGGALGSSTVSLTPLGGKPASQSHEQLHSRNAANGDGVVGRSWAEYVRQSAEEGGMFGDSDAAVDGTSTALPRTAAAAAMSNLMDLGSWGV